MELLPADGTVFHAQSFGAPIEVRGELGGQPRRRHLLSGASAESSPTYRTRFQLRPILFHGLGFEVGLEKRGLARSPAYFRSYFRELRGLGLPITDYGTLEVSIGDEPVNVFSEEQLSALDWSVYRDGFAKTIKLLELHQPVLNWGGDHTVAVSTVGGGSVRNFRKAMFCGSTRMLI
jgi:hypothetical protein